MSGIRARLLPGILMMTGLLSGCALRPAAPEVSWDERRARLLELSAWQARGRIAVKSESGGGQGDLQWEQAGAASRIRLSGPFGAGAYEIRWDPQMLTIASRNGELSRTYTGPDSAEQFLTEQLGWAFPAASTRFWLLGVLDPGLAGEEHFAPDGRLAGLSQNGWSVTYDRFTEQGGLAVPAKIILQNDRARVRLVIDRWVF
jgi:outer membrane lipoprotein LolB